ncbi:GNAT family N-acetyltransferase [Vagococcus zengguangii]|uniref:GNAT family N-acetyltransferase n=1 Tax=Vagococcus zengguangii TaxID=2571750 RepID=A0A4D7CVJ7_9ENTE|nr:GNAT family N-acetyltransferase [Vagococcus zengguangii]QCI87272.1 GNAT family N-acetyltransferase [Vagococcus zengguangii]TLG80776.1 GNAT family N-acetyltransferase [Vagococcus zengguangii]
MSVPPIKSVNLILAENRFMETEHLLLRPIDLIDVDAMYEYASDEEVSQFVFPTHQSLEETANTIANFFIADSLGKYAIVLKEKQKMIGTIDLQRLDEKNRKAEIGYTLAKDYWGQGLAPEAARQILWLAFDQLKLNVVSALHDVDNPKSGRVMEKIGMKPIGIFPNYLIHKEKNVDMKIYCLTREDYLAQQTK